MIGLTDPEGYRRLYEDRMGSEVMVWTAGGHFFRGILRDVDDAGLLVLDDVSCTLAGERQERERVYVDIDAVDAVS